MHIYRVAFCSVITFILSGCLGDIKYVVDENAVHIPARVVSVKTIESNWSPEYSQVAVSFGGVLVPFNVGAPQSEGNSHLYKVKTARGETVEIVTKFSGYKPGDCVDIVASEITETGLTWGYDCGENE